MFKIVMSSHTLCAGLLQLPIVEQGFLSHPAKICKRMKLHISRPLSENATECEKIGEASFHERDTESL